MLTEQIKIINFYLIVPFKIEYPFSSFNGWISMDLNYRQIDNKQKIFNNYFHN